MKNVEGFTLVFPNSLDNGTHGTRKYYTNGSDGISLNLSSNLHSLTPYIHSATPSSVQYISYYQFAGNEDGTGNPIYNTSNTTITMSGSAEANNTYGSNQFYGGGSRFAYIVDVSNSVSVLTLK